MTDAAKPNICGGVEQDYANLDLMFHQHRFDARPLLQAGENEIVVLLRAPHVVFQELHVRHGFHSGGHNNVSQARKAQYSTGWDWGPDLTSIGIWRSVRIESWSHARLMSTYACASTLTDEAATIEVQVETLATGAIRGELSIVIKDPDGKPVASAKVPVSLQAGSNCTKATATVRNPQRWWPLGYGTCHLR